MNMLSQPAPAPVPVLYRFFSLSGLGGIAMVPIKSDGHSWAEEIEVNWTKEIVRNKDLKHR